LLTCKEFLNELNEFLDEEAQGDVRRQLEEHLNECPNCWVVCDTTRKTVEIYKGMETYPIPADVHERLLTALQKKCARK
jgi:anti-sigma factor (TIGR02949 family)